MRTYQQARLGLDDEANTISHFVSLRMLTFLRKIRRSLIESGSARKYILYAIGEIALVVIGILIALQINNWNENQRGLRIEKASLLAMTKDLNSDLEWMMYIDSLHRSVIDSTSARLKILYQQKSEVEIRRLFGPSRQAIMELNPRMVTFEEMKNTGQLYSMKNDSLKEKILEHYRLVALREIDIYETNLGLEKIMYRPSMDQYFLILEMYDNWDDSPFDLSWINDMSSQELNSLATFLNASNMKSTVHSG